MRYIILFMLAVLKPIYSVANISAGDDFSAKKLDYTTKIQ